MPNKDWILPSILKEISYAPVKEIDFSSAKKLETNLDKTIENATTVQQPKHDKNFQIAMPGREKQ